MCLEMQQNYFRGIKTSLTYRMIKEKRILFYRINVQTCQIRFYCAINSKNAEQVPHCIREFLVTHQMQFPIKSCLVEAPYQC